METFSNSTEGLKDQWRAGFRKRIQNSLDFFRGQNAFEKTQARHFNAFNQTYSNNQTFRQEVQKLSPFELEVFCISSTLLQLGADSIYFTAAEVTRALAFRIKDQRHGEVRERILSEGHDDLGRLYHSVTDVSSATAGEEDRVNDIQRWIKASLNNHAVQRLFESMGREHTVAPLANQGNGVIGLAVQSQNSQAKSIPSISGSTYTAPSLPSRPTSNTMGLSISLSLNGTQADLFQQPHLCDQAHVLGAEFLDQVETVRELWLALKEPRPRKSRLSFLRFVFQYSPSHDQLALDRKLKLREMNSISLALCAATYTENMILGLSEGRFRALLSHYCKFLGGPGNIAASLPTDVIETSLTAKIIPEDHNAYMLFRKGLERHQRGHKAAPAPVPTRVSPHVERHHSVGNLMAWPQEHMAIILRMPLVTSFSVLLGQLARLYKENGRETPFPNDMTEALVAASKSVPLNDRMQILDTAAEMLTDSAPASASVHQFRYREAHEIARNIKVDGDIGEDQFQLLWDHIYCVGRVTRGKGDFESAKVCFEQCCAVTYGVRRSKVIIIQCALADLYCELDYLSGDHQHQYLLRAKSVLESASESVEGTNSKSRRRLLLSLSEVYVRQGQLHEATAILEGLLSIFNGLKSLDIVDRLGHVRLYMTLARSCPPEQARLHWREALRLNEA